jgi:metal-dependent amidase/aminoacylase/carboxypeptidase family protein
VGCPAEEDGGGKVLLIDAGVFESVDAALMMHPHSIERDAMATLALGEYRIVFSGGDGSSAVALTHMAIGQLRERLHEDERIHGITVDTSSCAWTIRAPSHHALVRLRDALAAIVEGAALMTGCVSHIVATSPEYAELRTDEMMAAMWRANATTLGRRCLPRQATDAYASTDMGNVSQVVPTIHPLVLVDEESTIHQHAFARAVVAARGDQAVMDGAVMLAWTVIDLVLARSSFNH